MLMAPDLATSWQLEFNYRIVTIREQNRRFKYEIRLVQRSWYAKHRLKYTLAIYGVAYLGT